MQFGKDNATGSPLPSLFAQRTLPYLADPSPFEVVNSISFPPGLKHLIHHNHSPHSRPGPTGRSPSVLPVVLLSASLTVPRGETNSYRARRNGATKWVPSYKSWTVWRSISGTGNGCVRGQLFSIPVLHDVYTFFFLLSFVVHSAWFPLSGCALPWVGWTGSSGHVLPG